MELGLFTLFVAGLVTVGIGLAVAATVWWVLMLVEALRFPDAQWAAAGQNKVVQVLLMVLLGVVGTLVYVLTARPELRRVGPPPPGYVAPRGY